MKKLILTTLLIGNFAALLFAGEFKSHIIVNTTLPITVPENRILRIRDFTQDGGTERAAVTATINGQSATVLLATVFKRPSADDPVSIAGGGPTSPAPLQFGASRETCPASAVPKFQL
jgi:hypothetical protein